MFGLTKKSTVEQLRAELAEKENVIKSLKNDSDYWRKGYEILFTKYKKLDDQLAKYKPVRGKGGKFVKKNQPEAAN